MIVVTGSRRSGTSLWMQLLAAAGLPVIGERVPASWEALAAEFNPGGFYESELTAGIYYKTNPHPRSGAYLFPEQTREHAVKVFVPGLVRSDVAFLDRVIASVRGWRAQCASLLRLQAATVGDAEPGLQVPPIYAWWADAFALLRDVATRRYPVHFVSLEALCADPEARIAEVLGWIGRGDRRAAAAAIRPRADASDGAGAAAIAEAALPDDFDRGHLALFDELHDHIHRGVPLRPALVAALNRVDAVLRPRLVAHNARVKDAAIERMLADARGGGQGLAM